MALTAVAVIADDMFLATGSDAPNFEGMVGDKAYSLQKMSEKGPVYVVFWKERCPHNKKASAIYNKLNEAYKDKVSFVGLVNASAEGAAKWTERFAVNYPLLADADKATIGAYKLKASICAFKIQDGKIAEAYGGYGREAIDSLNKAMAATAKADPVSLDGVEIPAGLTWG